MMSPGPIDYAMPPRSTMHTVAEMNDTVRRTKSLLCVKKYILVSILAYSTTIGTVGRVYMDR